MRLPRALVAIVMTVAFVPNAGLAKSHVDDKIQQQRAKIHVVHEKLNQKRGELDTARTREQSLQSQLDTTNHNIAAVNGRMADIQGRIRSTQRKLDWNQIQLRAAQRTLKRHQDALNRRLVDAYEHGDLGYLDSDGFLWVVGRQKEIIIRGGHNIVPGEVEAVLFEHPDVTDAAVAGIPHPVLGEDVAAWLVTRPDRAPSVATIRSFLLDRLADYKVPRRITLVDSLPRNEAGKVLKSQLVSEDQQRSTS